MWEHERGKIALHGEEGCTSQIIYFNIISGFNVATSEPNEA